MAAEEILAPPLQKCKFTLQAPSSEDQTCDLEVTRPVSLSADPPPSLDDKEGEAGLQTQAKTSLQSSHFVSCSNIPTQATDFHTAVEPNIGINEVYQAA